MENDLIKRSDAVNAVLELAFDDEDLFFTKEEAEKAIEERSAR